MAMRKLGLALFLATSLSGCNSYGGDVYAWDVGLAGIGGDGYAGSVRISGGSGYGYGYGYGACTSIYGCRDSYHTTTVITPCSSPFGCVWQSHNYGCGYGCGGYGSSWGNFGNDFYRKYRPHYMR